jgi:hypothetical protein
MKLLKLLIISILTITINFSLSAEEPVSEEMITENEAYHEIDKVLIESPFNGPELADELCREVFLNFDSLFYSCIKFLFLFILCLSAVKFYVDNILLNVDNILDEDDRENRTNEIEDNIEDENKIDEYYICIDEFGDEEETLEEEEIAEEFNKDDEGVIEFIDENENLCYFLNERILFIREDGTKSFYDPYIDDYELIVKSIQKQKQKKLKEDFLISSH